MPEQTFAHQSCMMSQNSSRSHIMSWAPQSFHKATKLRCELILRIFLHLLQSFAMKLYLQLSNWISIFLNTHKQVEDVNLGHSMSVSTKHTLQRVLMHSTGISSL